MQNENDASLKETIASERGLELTVQLYVRLRNLSALQLMRAHRIDLIAQHLDNSEFSFGLVGKSCREDIETIDAGIYELMKTEVARGHVDSCGVEAITGWAQYVQHPELAVAIEVYFDEKFIDRIIADRYREDLKLALLGSGKHAFEFKPPKEHFLRAKRIEVRTQSGMSIGVFGNRI